VVGIGSDPSIESVNTNGSAARIADLSRDIVDVLAMAAEHGRPRQRPGSMWGSTAAG
jgi:hypothetical protein